MDGLGGTVSAGDRIDAAIRDAEAAVAAGDHFQAERRCAHALRAVVHANAHARAGSLCLAYRECVERKRALAFDAARQLGVFMPSVKGIGQIDVFAGCYVLSPPLVAVAAQTLRERADDAKQPVSILTREPLTRAGLWPVVVSSATRTIRVRVEPPEKLERVPASITFDEPTGPPSLEWFTSVLEAIDREAVGQLQADEPAAWQAEDALELLEVWPESAALIDALARACEQAAEEPVPELPRRRALVDDPHSF